MDSVQLVFAGVAKRCVSQIVPQSDGFDQVFVEVQGSGDGAGYLRYLQRMSEAGDEMVSLRGNEDLSLVLQAAERLRVDDPVSIALELGPYRGGLFRNASPSALAGPGREGRESRFPFLQATADCRFYA